MTAKIVKQKLEASWLKALKGRTIKELLQDEQKSKEKSLFREGRIEHLESELEKESLIMRRVQAKGKANDLVILILKNSHDKLIGDVEEVIQDYLLDIVKEDGDL